MCAHIGRHFLSCSLLSFSVADVSVELPHKLQGISKNYFPCSTIWVPPPYFPPSPWQDFNSWATRTCIQHSSIRVQHFIRHQSSLSSQRVIFHGLSMRYTLPLFVCQPVQLSVYLSVCLAVFPSLHACLPRAHHGRSLHTSIFLVFGFVLRWCDVMWQDSCLVEHDNGEMVAILVDFF